MCIPLRRQLHVFTMRSQLRVLSKPSINWNFSSQSWTAVSLSMGHLFRFVSTSIRPSSSRLLPNYLQSSHAAALLSRRQTLHGSSGHIRRDEFAASATEVMTSA
jgi:hypothetical protein